MAHGGKVFTHSFDNKHAQFLMGHLASTKLKVNFDLVPFVEELLRMSNFGEVIVLADVHTELDFLHFASRVFFVLFLLGKVIAELAKIQDPADGRLRMGSDFNEVQSESLGPADGIIGADDANLFVGDAIDDPHLSGADTFIDADIFDINKLTSSGLFPIRRWKTFQVVEISRAFSCVRARRNDNSCSA